MKNQKDLIVTGLALAAAIFTFAGCETTPKDERSAGRTLDDKKITENIRKSLDSEPTYKFNSVAVSTFAGIVQLSGFVNSDGQKGRAQDIAQRADGVREVFNGITIKPAMPTATGKGGSKIYTEPQGSSGQPGRDNNSNQTTEPK